MPYKDPEKSRKKSHERMLRWRAANPERVRELGRENMARRRAADPEGMRESDRQQHARRRDAVFDHYGRVCACPGCGSVQRLVIDHVNGDGRRHRAQIGTGSRVFYLWLIRNGFPDGFQTLCESCNSSKQNGNRCRLDHARAPEGELVFSLTAGAASPAAGLRK